MFVAVLLIVLSCQWCVIETLSIRNEPKCFSKYDFLDNLLERLIRMELQWETLQAKTVGDLEKFANDNARFRDEFASTQRSLEEQLKMINATVDKVVKDAKEQVEETRNSVEVQTLQKLDKLDHRLKDLNAAADNVDKSVTERLEEMNNIVESKLASIDDHLEGVQVAFHVQNVEEQPANGAVVKFKDVVTNVGDAYDVNTGVFTAPTGGVYWFSAMVCSNTKKILSPSIYVNNKLLARVFSYYDKNPDCTTVSVVTLLKGHDTVTLKAITHGYSSPVWIRDDTFHVNTFMGARIS